MVHIREFIAKRGLFKLMVIPSNAIFQGRNVGQQNKLCISGIKTQKCIQPIFHFFATNTVFTKILMVFFEFPLLYAILISYDQDRTKYIHFWFIIIHFFSKKNVDHFIYSSSSLHLTNVGEHLLNTRNEYLCEELIQSETRLELQF